MLAILLLTGCLASAAYARDFNCTVDAALCTGYMSKSVTMDGVTMCCPLHASMSFNNNRDCLCTENPADAKGFDCPRDTNNCREGTSFTTDAQGVLRCCLPGYHMTTAMVTDANGQPETSCRCSLAPGGVGGSGGMFSTFLGMGNPWNSWIRPQNLGMRNPGGAFMAAAMPGLAARLGMTGSSSSNNNNGGGPNAAANATETREQWRKVGEDWKNWGQQFLQGFHTWGRNFGQNMRNTGLDLARDLSGVLQTTLSRTTVPIQRAVSDMVGNIFQSIPRV